MNRCCGWDDEKGWGRKTVSRAHESVRAEIRPLMTLKRNEYETQLNRNNSPSAITCFPTWYASLLLIFLLPKRAWSLLHCLQFFRINVRPKRVFSRFAYIISSHSSSFFHHYIMLRSPLTIIFSNRRYKIEYIFYQRKLITKIVEFDITFETIQKIHEISKSIVQFIIKNVKIDNNDEFASRFDRFKSFFIRDQRHIFRIVRRNSKIIYKKLVEQVEVTCNHDIIYRLLKEKNIINWLIKKRFLLTSEIIAKRYQWTLKHESWKFEKWIKIIWSNECSIERNFDKRRQWIFRTLNQKWNKKIIQFYKKTKTSTSWFEFVFEIWNDQIFMFWIEISITNVTNIQPNLIWNFLKTICSKFTNQISYLCKITFLFIQSKRLSNDSTITI